MEVEVEDEFVEERSPISSSTSELPFQILYRIWFVGAMFLINYGWYLFGMVILYGAFRHKIHAAYRKWRLRRDEFEYSAKYHKDSELARSRMEAVIAAREKMQREHERMAVEAQMKRQRLEMEEKTRAASTAENSTSTKGLKADYFPLMGETTTGGYKAPKKSCCKKGGGCG